VVAVVLMWPGGEGESTEASPRQEQPPPSRAGVVAGPDDSADPGQTPHLSPPAQLPEGSSGVTIVIPGQDNTAESSRQADAGRTDAATTGRPAAISDKALAKLYADGQAALNAGELVKARALLSKAYFSGKLPADRQRALIADLTTISEATLIGAKTIFPGDTLVESYQVKPGDVLIRIERSKKLRVPYQLLVRVNSLRDAGSLRAGQKIKLVRGPFHAIVDKSEFAMDIYTNDADGNRIFVRRLPVGLGASGKTPPGMWRVTNKLTRPVYNPAPNSPLRERGAIRYGEPDYAFGKTGLWIGLEGMDAANADEQGYGIHSTDKPESIGKAESEGCIRMGDDDVQLVYALLYESFSTVEIRE
jgi:hypothetical protein